MARAWLVLNIILLSFGTIACDQWPEEAAFAPVATNPSAYDQEVLRDKPVLISKCATTTLFQFRRRVF